MKSLENVQDGKPADGEGENKSDEKLSRRAFLKSVGTAALGVAALGIEGSMRTLEAGETPIENFKKKYPKLSADPMMAKFFRENPGINDADGHPEEFTEIISEYYASNVCNGKKIREVAIPGFVYQEALFLEKEGKIVPDEVNKLVPRLRQQEFIDQAKKTCIERRGVPHGY